MGDPHTDLGWLLWRVREFAWWARTPCYGRRYTLAEAWEMAGGCMRLRQRVVACDRAMAAMMARRRARRVVEQAKGRGVKG